MLLPVQSCLLMTMLAASAVAQSATDKPAISPVRAIYVQDQRDRGVAMADNGDALKQGETVAAGKELSWKT